MLKVGEEKVKDAYSKVKLVHGNAMELPFSR